MVKHGDLCPRRADLDGVHLGISSQGQLCLELMLKELGPKIDHIAEYLDLTSVFLHQTFPMASLPRLLQEAYRWALDKTEMQFSTDFTQLMRMEQGALMNSVEVALAGIESIVESLD